MRTLFYLIFSLFIYTAAFSQAPPQITISQEKINENGVVKYVHNVKQGETLYSLSKAYNVTTQVIVDNNPTLKNGLKTGMIIFIPVLLAEPETIATTTQIVTKKESNTISTNNAEMAKSKTIVTNNKKYKKHTAKWYESLDDIALKYNVPADAIYTLNNLSSTKLAKRQQLLIPNEEYIESYKNSIEIKSEEIKDNEPLQEAESTSLLVTDGTNNLYNNSNSYFGTPLVQKIDLNRELNISIILPINGGDTIPADKNFLEFYAGALLAIDTLKYSGTNINLTLIDQKLGSAINSINYSSLLNTDLIIGPIRNSDIKGIANLAEETSTPVVSPMDMSVENILYQYNNLIQAPALSKMQINNIVEQLDKDITADTTINNVVLCYEQWGTDTALVRAAKEQLNLRNIKYKIVSYTILEGREIFEKMSLALSDSLNNYVLIPSNNQGFVNDAVRNLGLVYNNFEKLIKEEKKNKSFTINLFGMPRWRSFETIEPSVFHKMNLKLTLPYYVDYSSSEVKSFLYKYRALFNAEPSPYAYQGYDIAKYFINMVQLYGKEFIQASELPKANMMQSNYNFTRDNAESGLNNNATRTIVYNKDYTVSVID